MQKGCTALSASAENLGPTSFIDADHPTIVAFSRAHTDPQASARENAVSLYYAVRDGWRYNPYNVVLHPDAFRASAIAARDGQEGGHCIDKALVLAAAARAAGIPARLHFANVRNHIGTEKLERMLETDLLVFHGYNEIYLEGRWCAATPAFNKELCHHLNVEPLEWDGRSDSIFQQYDAGSRRFMEYVHDYGAFSDVPWSLMIGEWEKYYPSVRNGGRWPKPVDGAAGV